MAPLLVVMFAGSASAQNRIVLNPDFDDSDQGTSWQSSSGSWLTSDDADGCHASPVGSGSLVTQSIPDAGGPGISLAYAGAGDCLNVQPGQVLQTEIAFRSPFVVAVGGGFYPQTDCGGTGDVIDFLAFADPSPVAWDLAALPIVVPANRFSMRVWWASADFENSAFETRFDRAYAGALPRVFADDFEAATFCRWSFTDGSDDIEPPSAPGPIVSSTHDGGPAPPPMHFSWGASTDTGGSGLARYRAGLGTTTGPVVSCGTLENIGLVTDIWSSPVLPPGNYLFAICAEDHAGNRSEVVITGPYEVN